MVCIYCQHETGVINSRHQKKLNQVWRRRQCQSCKSVFTTLEAASLLTSLSVEYKNSYKPFLRDKLFMSVYDSLKHRKTALNDATALTDTIISKLYAHVDTGRLQSRQIINVAHNVLKRFDKAAAIYYEAYHPPDG